MAKMADCGEQTGALATGRICGLFSRKMSIAGGVFCADTTAGVHSFVIFFKLSIQSRETREIALKAERNKKNILPKGDKKRMMLQDY